MKVEELLESIEDLLHNSWELPLSKGKGLADVGQIKELLEQIKQELPEEVSQAKAIVSDRSQIIEDAKKEALSLVEKAENKSSIMISREEIVKQAEISADNIVNEAKKRSNEIRRAANDYVEDLMKRTDEILTANLSDFRKSRQNLRSPQNNAE